MRIICLGAGGQLGRELDVLFKELCKLANNIGIEYCGFTRSQLDVCDFAGIEHKLREFSPSFIINAAAYTAVDQAESEPETVFSVNDTAVGNLAMLCDQFGCGLIHISTDYVFHDEGNQRLKEQQEVSPQNIYGQSKLAGEEKIRRCLRKHIILRTAWVFGRHGNNFVKTMLRLAQDRDSVRVVNDQIGSPTSAKAISEAILKIVLEMRFANEMDPRWGTYHFSGTPYISWAMFAEEIFTQAYELDMIDKVPSLERVVSSDYPTDAARPLNSRLDCDKINSIFGVQPDDWRMSLRRVLVQIRERSLN